MYNSCSLQTSSLVGLLYSWLSMDGNTTSSPSSTASLNPPPLSSLDTTILVLFGVIAAASFVFNLLFCIVLLRKPSMLRKPHNILLFSLAVADMLTGEIHTNELPNLRIIYILSWLALLKEFRQDLGHLEKFSLHFSSSLFVIIANFPHLLPSLFLYGLALSL